MKKIFIFIVIINVMIIFYYIGNNYTHESIPVETPEVKMKDNAYKRTEKYKLFLQEKAKELESDDFEIVINPYSSGMFCIEIYPIVSEDNKRAPLHDLEFYKEYSEKIVNQYIDLIEDGKHLYNDGFFDKLFFGTSDPYVEIKIFDYFIFYYKYIYSCEVFRCSVSVNGKYEMNFPWFDEEIFLNSVSYEEAIDKINNTNYTVYPEDNKKIDYEYDAHLYDDPDEFYNDYQEEFEDEDEAYLHWEFYH